LVKNTTKLTKFYRSFQKLNNLSTKARLDSCCSTSCTSTKDLKWT